MALLIDGKKNLIDSKKKYDFKDPFIDKTIVLENISNDNTNHKASCSCEIEVSNGNFDKRYFVLICKEINFTYALEGNVRPYKQPINSIYDKNSSFTWEDPSYGKYGATIQYTSEISETLGKIKITFETALPKGFNLTYAHLIVDFIVYDVNVEGDVSIGGSLTIPSDKNIVVNTIENSTVNIGEMKGGSININSLNNGNVKVNNIQGGTLNILNKSNGLINIQDVSNIRADNIIEVYTKNDTDINWYYIPKQEININSSTFILPETIMNKNGIISIPLDKRGEYYYYLRYIEGSVKIEYFVTPDNIHYDDVTYYKLPIKVIEVKNSPEV